MKMIIEEEHKSCLECGREVYGRPDKVFCSSSCKNRFNNRKISAGTKCRNRVIGILKANYAILEKILSQGRTSVSLGELAALGFNSAYVTGCHRAPRSHEERQCFDILYYQTDSRIFNIHRIVP